MDGWGSGRSSPSRNRSAADLPEDFEGIDTATRGALDEAAKRDSATGRVMAVTRSPEPTDPGGIELAKALDFSSWLIDVPSSSSATRSTERQGS